MADCVHEWKECDTDCDICGWHPAVICENCCILIDIVHEEDPREI